MRRGRSPGLAMSKTHEAVQTVRSIPEYTRTIRNSIKVARVGRDRNSRSVGSGPCHIQVQTREGNRGRGMINGAMHKACFLYRQ